MSVERPIGSDDERAHEEPAGAADWVESWTFELAPAQASHGISGVVALARRPGRGLASWNTSLVGPGVGIISVRDDDVPLPRRPGSLELRGDGLWAELVCETPFEHWGIALEAFGLRLDAPDDDVGERLPVGLDLEWETTAPVEGAATADGGRYHQDGFVHGVVLIGADRYEHIGPGRRAHQWGPTPFMRP